MYISARIDNEDVHAVLLYYSDPKDFHLPRNFWPPSAILKKDISLYIHHGILPEAKLILYPNGFNEQPSIVDGFIQCTMQNFSFLSMEGCKFPIDILKYDAINKEAQRIDHPFSRIPILQGKNQVDWVSIEFFHHSRHGKDMVKSWIGALVLQLIRSVYLLCKIMKMPRSEQLEMIESQESLGVSPGRFMTSQDTILWVWWAIPKPKELSCFFEGIWKRVLSFQEVYITYKDCHPVLSGFHRVLFSDCTTYNDKDGCGVVLTWHMESQLSYMIEIEIGRDDSGEQGGFGPNGNDKVKIVLQNTANPHFISKQRWTSWDAECDTIPEDCFFVQHDPLKAPSWFSHSRVPQQNINELKDWISSRICPGQKLPNLLKKRFESQGELYLKLLWK